MGKYEIRLSNFSSQYQTWVAIPFAFTLPAVVTRIKIEHLNPETHHVDFNCCPVTKHERDLKHVAWYGTGLNVTYLNFADFADIRSAKEPAIFPGTCAHEVEGAVWTYPQDNTNLLKFPLSSGLAVGPGSMCEFCALAIHFRAAVDLRAGNTQVNFDTEIRPSVHRFTQPLYFHRLSSFAIPRRVSCWIVSTSTRYAGEEDLTVFSIKLHTHYQGRLVSVFHVSRGKRTLLIAKDPASQAWFPLPEIKVLHGDVFEAECWYETQLINKIIRHGIGIKNEMCWVYMQVFTSSVVSFPLNNVLVQNVSQETSRGCDVGTLYDVLGSPTIARGRTQELRQKSRLFSIIVMMCAVGWTILGNIKAFQGLILL